MKNYSLWVIALIMGIGAVAVMETKGKDNQNSTRQTSSAAFRDGAYVGKLAALQGDAPHIAVGRWATNADRELFATGYDESYRQNLMLAQDSRKDQTDAAAFRDGLYLGKLDAERGNALHIAVGRWVNESDRGAFEQGYRQAYGESQEARLRQGQSVRQLGESH